MQYDSARLQKQRLRLILFGWALVAANLTVLILNLWRGSVLFASLALVGLLVALNTLRFLYDWPLPLPRVANLWLCRRRGHRYSPVVDKMSRDPTRTLVIGPWEPAVHIDSCQRCGEPRVTRGFGVFGSHTIGSITITNCFVSAAEIERALGEAEKEEDEPWRS